MNIEKATQEVIDRNQHPKLAAATIQQHGGLTEDNFKYPSDYMSCEAGVNGFIYFNETSEFYDKNKTLIVSMVEDYEEEMGEELDIPCYLKWETQHKNHVAWLVWENLAYEIHEYAHEMNYAE